MNTVGIVIAGFCIGVAGAVGAGCSQAPSASARGEALTRALAMTPTDARLAGLYGQSCKACHTALDSGAPLAGDREAWASRWAKGMPTLVQSTVGGLGGMPAGGQCFACQPADFEALIRFMADRPS